MTVIDDIISGSDSTWVDWTEPTTNGFDVSRVDPFKVKFTKLLDQSCLNNHVFKLYDMNGAEVVDAFTPISVGNDFDPISMILELHLSAPLNSKEQYTFVIDGLYDAVGDTQDIIHSVPFMTNDADIDWTLDASGPSVISVVDHTISSATIAPYTSASGRTAYMNPASGSYNLASTIEDLVFVVTPADLDPQTTTVSAVVNRRVVSNMETIWETLAATVAVTDTSHITLTLPTQSGGFIAAGYEYDVVLTIDTDTFNYKFAGVLDPMFASVTNVLIQSPDLDSFEAAKMIYLSSAYVLDLQPSLASAPSKAAQDYALYNTLATITPVDTMEGYVLADLEVKRKKSAQQKWAELAAQALAKIDSAAPRFLVKGSANTSPHAKRDFGSTNPRIGQ